MKAYSRFYKNHLGTLSYRIFLGGSKTMLAFHGFGQNSNAMAALASEISAEYTTYSFDLFFHGNSTLKNTKNPLTENDWKIVLEGILEENRIETFSIAAFSIGGKFALSTLISFPQKIKELILIAPDGIGVNPWYALATGTGLLRSYFRSMIKKPNRFFGLLSVLHKLRIIDRPLYRFVSYHMGSEEKRRQVYNSWVVFRSMNYSDHKIAQLLNHHRIMLKVFLGKYDQVIFKKNIERWLKKVILHELTVLDAKHGELLANVAPLVMTAYGSNLPN